MQNFVGKPQRMTPVDDLGVNTMIILKIILKIRNGRMWKGFIWPKIGASGRPMQIFGFYKMLGVF
jgi:hypothetical protein